MKKGHVFNFSFSRDDVAKIRFVSNRSFIIGDHLFSYESPMRMMDDLMYFARGLSDVEKGYRTDCFLSEYSDVEKVNNIADYPAAKTIEEMFDAAVNLLLHNKTLYWGEIIKYVPDDESAFMMEVFGMQDALYYALEDLRSYTGEAGLTEEKIFNEFVGNMGYWWVADLCGLPRAMGMLESFFKKYYPVISSRVERS